MIKLVNVSKYYHGEGVVTLGLRKINLELKTKEFVVLTGESGSGKSTLLNVICGIDTYEEGEMYIKDEETSYYDESDWENYRRQSVGFIFQNYNLIDSYTVYENVEAAMIIQGLSRKERRQKALDILEKVGLRSHIKHKATKLSGGQKQRLAIARALAKDTDIIAADEPTGNLDSVSGRQIIDLLYEISKEKLVIIVTHNSKEVEHLATRKIRLFDGEVASDDTVSEVLESTSEKKETNHSNSTIKKTFLLAAKNLKAQPRKTFFLTTVALTLTIVLYIIILSYMAIVQETSGVIAGPQNNYFANNYEERIIVTKKDRTEITDQDLNMLSNLNYINSINQYSIVMDLRVSYTRDEIFTGMYSNNTVCRSISLIDVRQLSYGRMPENSSEAVVSRYFDSQEEAEKFLNKEYTLYNYRENLGALCKVKIVGVIPTFDDNNYVFISPEIEKEIFDSYSYKVSFTSFGLGDENILNYLIPVPQIQIDNQLKGNNVIYYDYMPNSATVFDINGHKCTGTTVVNDGKAAIVYISAELAQTINTYQNKQISINARRHSDVKSIIADINKLDAYYAFSPFDYSYSFSFLENILSFILGAFLLAPLLVGIYFISYLVFKLIMLTKKRDYTIFRMMGLNANGIKSMTSIEIIGVIIFAFLLVTLLINLAPGMVSNYDIYVFLKSLRFNNYLMVFIFNLLFGFLIARKYNKMLMKKSLLANLRIE